MTMIVNLGGASANDEGFDGALKANEQGQEAWTTAESIGTLHRIGIIALI